MSKPKRSRFPRRRGDSKKSTVSPIRPAGNLRSVVGVSPRQSSHLVAVAPHPPPSTESLAPSFRNDGPRAMTHRAHLRARRCRTPASSRLEATPAPSRPRTPSARRSIGGGRRRRTRSRVSPLAWSAFAEAFAPQSVQPTSAAITTGPTLLVFRRREPHPRAHASPVLALTLGSHARLLSRDRGSASSADPRVVAAGSADVDFASPSPFAAWTRVVSFAESLIPSCSRPDVRGDVRALHVHVAKRLRDDSAPPKTPSLLGAARRPSP